MHTFLAVVVSYGGSPQLRRLLAALTEMDRCQVALVENRNGTAHDDLPAGVDLYEGHGNVGYGTAVNIAVRGSLLTGASREASDETSWILVVNSDVTISAETCALLPELLDSVPADTDALGFQLRDEDGRPGRGTAVLPSVRTNAYTAVRGEPAAIARWPELRYPVGAFFAIRTASFLHLGGFDPDFWMYYEETDLFARLHEAGGRVGWADDRYDIAHVGGGTVGRAGLLYAELGRSAAVYARRHRRSLGDGWLPMHLGQLALLILRKLATGRTHDALRATRILSGVATGLARPGWEPATQTPWSAVPAARRRDLGSLDLSRPGAGGMARIPTPRPAVGQKSWAAAER